jgi:large subunit ribosomal protein L18
MKLVREKALARRHRRVRAKVSGTTARPRLAVHRSLLHIYAQIIDDTTGCTLVAASSNEPTFREQATAEIKGSNIIGAKAVGQLIAQRALANGITTAVFDRGGYFYHGRVKSLADGAREGGLVF